MTNQRQEREMRNVLMTIMVVSFVLSGCSNPSLTAEGDAGTNDNQNNNVTNPDPDPDSDWQCNIVLKSSQRIAVWLETESGWFKFGPEKTLDDCPTGPEYSLGFNPLGIFAVAAEHDLDMITDGCMVDMRKIEENPAAPFNYWEFESTLNSFWLLPPYWVFDFFPQDESRAEGFELSASAFICALDLDMLNLGCDGHIDDAFFKPEGIVTHDKYFEGNWMPILRFGVVRRN